MDGLKRRGAWACAVVVAMLAAVAVAVAAQSPHSLFAAEITNNAEKLQNAADLPGIPAIEPQSDTADTPSPGEDNNPDVPNSSPSPRASQTNRNFVVECNTADFAGIGPGLARGSCTIRSTGLTGQVSTSCTPGCVALPRVVDLTAGGAQPISLTITGTGSQLDFSIRVSGTSGPAAASKEVVFSIPRAQQVAIPDPPPSVKIESCGTTKVGASTVDVECLIHFIGNSTGPVALNCTVSSFAHPLPYSNCRALNSPSSPAGDQTVARLSFDRNPEMEPGSHVASLHVEARGTGGAAGTIDSVVHVEVPSRGRVQVTCPESIVMRQMSPATIQCQVVGLDGYEGQVNLITGQRWPGQFRMIPSVTVSGDGTPTTFDVTIDGLIIPDELPMIVQGVKTPEATFTVRITVLTS